MKILFAVSNESISDAIVKKYQKNYKEIISYKNVYYFNAIMKEIERDKSYDRIVISEDLEPFANNNYETIDRFLFEKLDAISDEASNGEGTDIPIVLICTDRREKTDGILLKLFSIGIYNAIIGQDRSIDEVCNLINKPRTKKEAKIYYKIESDDANYQAEDEDSVSEAEIQNILAHYKRLGKNSNRYVDSFNNIAAQYTEQQMKVIIKFLPLNVKVVLESESPRYQEIVASANGKPKRAAKAQVRVKQPSANKSKIEDIKVDLLEDIQDTYEPRTDVIIPAGINTSKVRKTKIEKAPEEPIIENFQPDIPEKSEETTIEPVKKKRGRPKKIKEPEEVEETKPKKERGRPKKVQEQLTIEEEPEVIERTETIEEPDFQEEIQEDDVIKPIDLFNLDEEIDDTNEVKESQTEELISNNDSYQAESIDSLITKDKKIVAFVGTSKNGTSFIVNNLALQLSQSGIDTAIVDLTKNKNSYYIYTSNQEALRKTAINCFDKLKDGIASGIPAYRNLTIYTSLPGVDNNVSAETVLSTIIKKHSLVLLDCDFDTDYRYFENAQELYLVQSMDILTIQPLTAFLRDLKSKNVLKPEKLRIVINKETKVKGLTPKVLIGGMSMYNEPAMTFMTELFDRNSIKYCTIPFELENCTKYMESLVECKFSLNNYSKTFIANLKALSNLVYPLLPRQPYQSTTVANSYENKSNDNKRKLFNFGK